MRRAALATGVALLVPAAGAAAQHEHHDAGHEAAQVAMAFADFTPPVRHVLVGERVTWRNDSLRPHTVTAEDGTFDSPRVLPGQAFSRGYDAPGSHPYFCRLHPGMRGEVGVHHVLLDAPAEPTAPGVAYALGGRTSLAPGATVRIQADAGAGFADVASATVGDDGTLAATVVPRTSTRYRAVAEDRESPAVDLRVLDRKVTATARTRGRRATVDAVVTPADARVTVVLQLFLPQRFGWWPVARARTDARGRAVLRTPVGRRRAARVVVTLADGATRLATSRILRVGR